MKLGISMLILGLLLASCGVFIWLCPTFVCTPGCYTSNDAAMWKSLGGALVVFGGGLTLGGLVRMILRRK